MKVLFRFLPLCLALWFGLAAAQAQGVITVEPNIVDTGTSPEVMVQSSGFFDLSELQNSQISIKPDAGVSDLHIVFATAQRMKLAFTLSPDAATGIRTLRIKSAAGEPLVALDIALRTGPGICRPGCVDPQVCRNNVCTGCSPACPEGERCVGTVCHFIPPPPPPVCRPACVPPRFFCNEFGNCEEAS